MSTETAIWIAIFGAAVGSYFWRYLGVRLSKNLSPTAPIILWCKYIAYATVSAIVIRMVVLPSTVLQNVEWWIRIGGLVFFLLILYPLRSHLLLSVLLAWSFFLGLYFLHQNQLI